MTILDKVVYEDKFDLAGSLIILGGIILITLAIPWIKEIFISYTDWVSTFFN